MKVSEAPVVYCGFPGCIPGQVCNLSQYREVLSPRPGPGSSARQEPVLWFQILFHGEKYSLKCEEERRKLINVRNIALEPLHGRCSGFSLVYI